MDKETLIARLIVSYLCGEMSDKTKDYERLQAWVGARASHRRLFQELCSLEAVKEDVRARETVDSKSALEDMRRRIHDISSKEAQENNVLESEHPVIRTWFRSLRWWAAAVIVFIVSLSGIGGWEYYTHVSKWKAEALTKAGLI